MYPVLISLAGIFVGLLTLLVQSRIYPVKDMPDVETALKGIPVISTVLMAPVAVLPLQFCLPAVFTVGAGHDEVKWWFCAVSIMLRLWTVLFIGYVAKFFTSHSYMPVREIATQMQFAAAGIICGLALGFLSCIVPVLYLGVTILIVHTLCGMFSVALGALGMLGTTSGPVHRRLRPLLGHRRPPRRDVGPAENCAQPDGLPRRGGQHHGRDRQGLRHRVRGPGQPRPVRRLYGARHGVQRRHPQPVGLHWLALRRHDALRLRGLDGVIRGHRSERHGDNVPHAVPKIVGPQMTPDYETCIRISSVLPARDAGPWRPRDLEPVLYHTKAP